MPNFHYIALDAKGNEVEGTVSADNQSAAISKVREKGLYPSNVSLSEGGGGKKKSKPKKGESDGKSGGGMKTEIKLPLPAGRVKPKQLMTFTRQLATLVHAGMPLVRGLQVLERQERSPRLKKAIGEIIESIQGGQTFAESLAQHGKIFDRLYVNMVKAGELGGVLDVVLDRLALFMEKAQKLKSTIISSMVYPVVVLIVAAGIVGFLMTYIVPRFEQIFNDLLQGAKLPALTQFVMNLSEKLTTGLLPTIGVIVGIVVLVKLLGKLRAGRYAVDYIKLKIPLFGKLRRLSSISRFSRTLGTLMASGVPVLQALTIVRETAGNILIENAINEVHDAVKEGENMAPPIEACGLFPPIVVSMVEVGEETGELPNMLINIADAYDDEVDNAVTALTSIIEPLLIVMLALVVGTIVIALFLPMINIIGKLG
ncbi:type II secretion system F family protein [Kiritimatiella glycovorans]|uniref:Pilus assembly protein n=1 Tax=Kiritimatiella glycovorans TaxID=1307763 RepID=A0A0G3EAP0_9BACT|nr:type II secretion system F family protein [Kiritimatiella glycovorans]AKJ63546.1 pilus assembly protein [Kiritimatiella glycovorans]